MRAAVVGKQALFKRLKLAWPGGPQPRNAKRVLAKIGKALRVAEEVLAALPESVADELVPMPGGSEHAELLHIGSRDGLRLQVGTVQFAQRELERAEEVRAADPMAPIDYKLLRLGNDAANQLNRLAVRVAEGAFRAQKDDVLLRLLERWGEKPPK